MTDNRAQPHGFDAVDLDIIKRGDMLGSKLGERVFEALTAPHRTPTPEIDGLIGKLRSRAWEDRQHRQLRERASDKIAKLLAHISALEERFRDERSARHSDLRRLCAAVGVNGADGKSSPSQIFSRCIDAIEGLR